MGIYGCTDVQSYGSHGGNGVVKFAHRCYEYIIATHRFAPRGAEILTVFAITLVVSMDQWKVINHLEDERLMWRAVASRVPNHSS